MRPSPEFRSGQIHAVRILMLEDDPAFADLVRVNLRRVPWVALTLEHVATLASALERLGGESFDLVISDLNLPDSKGLGTLDALSGATDRLILLLTGDAGETPLADALARGAYDMMSKDKLDAVELGRVVRLAAMQARAFHSLREHA